MLLRSGSVGQSGWTVSSIFELGFSIVLHLITSLDPNVPTVCVVWG